MRSGTASRRPTATAVRFPRPSALAVAAGGALMACCWMPTGLAPLLPVAAFLVLRGARGVETMRQATAFGLIGALAYQGIAAHFLLVLMRYSWLAFVLYPMTVAYYVLYWIALFTGALLLERRVGLPRRLGLVLLWPLLEVLKTASDASFPADLLAYTFGTNPAWLAWMPWTGPYGMSLLVWSLGAILDVAWERRRERRLASGLLAAALAVWFAVPLTDALRHEGGPEAGARFRVGMVQPFIEVQAKLDRSQWPSTWQRLERLTLEAAEGSDLVLWPETTRPGPLVWRDGEPLSDPEVEALAEKAGVPILYGCEIVKVRGDRIVALYNGAAMALPAGMSEKWYGKQRLLPFVEGVPFAGLVGWDPSKREIKSGRRSPLTLLGNFSRGPEPTVFRVGEARIGVLVCYEGMYPELGRAYARAGVNLLAVITNDAWWGRSIFPAWHAGMVGSFARSLDIPVVRAANSGICSVTDSSGRMTAASELSAITTMRAGVPIGPGSETWYESRGQLIPWGIGVCLVFCSLFSARRTRRPAP